MAIEKSSGDGGRQREGEVLRGFAFKRRDLELSMLAKGWTRGDLAIAAGVSVATLTKVFAGGRVSQVTAQKITSALSKTPDTVDVTVLARSA
jgi:DNA-binding Xre family transcriptional regulator